jgi:NCAIR mutase (PurE)-related protein
MLSDWDLTPDHSRAERIGFDEAIFCAGKSVDQIHRILAGAIETGSSLLLTRLSADKLVGLPNPINAKLDYDSISQTAILGQTSRELTTPEQVAIVSAGTSDVGVAREAARTLEYYGIDAREIHDAGVAGLWRLLERVDELSRMSVVITVAGMEGTLPTVVAGLVPGLVIAVPGSTGYGVGTDGIAALHGALASCAPGLVVVNVDNGYGAGCAALRVLNARSMG